MNLKQAREIARQVGATIEEKREEIAMHDDQGSVAIAKSYLVRLGVCKIGANGTREEVKIEATSPREAADLACIETGRNARSLLEVTKRVYADSDLIFGAPRS